MEDGVDAQVHVIAKRFGPVGVQAVVEALGNVVPANLPPGAAEVEVLAELLAGGVFFMEEGHLVLAVVELVANAEAPLGEVYHDIGSERQFADVGEAVHLVAGHAAEGHLEAVQRKQGRELELQIRVQDVVIHHALDSFAAGIMVEAAFPTQGHPGRYPALAGAHKVKLFAAGGAILSAPVQRNLIVGFFPLPAQEESIDMRIKKGRCIRKDESGVAPTHQRVGENAGCKGEPAGAVVLIPRSKLCLWLLALCTKVFAYVEAHLYAVSVAKADAHIRLQLHGGQCTGRRQNAI